MLYYVSMHAMGVQRVIKGKLLVDIPHNICRHLLFVMEYHTILLSDEWNICALP